MAVYALDAVEPLGSEVQAAAVAGVAGVLPVGLGQGPALRQGLGMVDDAAEVGLGQAGGYEVAVKVVGEVLGQDVGGAGAGGLGAGQVLVGVMISRVSMWARISWKARPMGPPRSGRGGSVGWEGCGVKGVKEKSRST